jgi:uncharacterized protein (TIGR00255 family)
LRARVEQLLDGTGIVPEAGRLEVELAFVADRLDVSEELVRLDSHFQQLADLLASDDAVGRRVDFLLQEVSREVNTLAAKCQDAGVSQRAVELKAEIARMRQQGQNVA